MRHILIKPVITEQSMENAKNHKYTFLVAKEASKTMIKDAIEAKFTVNVISLTTAIVKGRTKRVGKKRTQKVDSAFKKAIARVKNDQKIDLFDVA